MEQKIIKLGIVGAGRGHSQGQLSIMNPKCKVTALCDRNPVILEECKNLFIQWGHSDFECYSEYEDMLANADIDAVVVATDKPLHTQHVIMALRAGKHVLSEIPAIETLEEATLLKNEVLAHPELKYMVGENCCFWAFIESWKKMYEDGKFGEAVYAEAEYLHSTHPDELKPYPTEHWRKYSPAITYLTHELGPLLYIMNDRCVSVSCLEPDVVYNPYRVGPATGVALFKTAKGAVIRILICFGAYTGFDHNFALYGTRGSILTDKTKPLDKAHSFAKFYDIPGSFEESIEIPLGCAYSGASTVGHGGAEPRMMDAFFNCILEDTKPILDIDDAIRMSLPGILAHESALQGGAAIEIPDI